VQTQLKAEKFERENCIHLKPAPNAVGSFIKEIQAILSPYGVGSKAVAAAFNEIRSEIGITPFRDDMEDFRTYMLGTVVWKIFGRGNTPWICPETRSGNEVPVDLLVNAYSLWKHAVDLSELQGVDAAAAAEAYVRAVHITADRIASAKRHNEIGEIRDAPKYLFSTFRHQIPRIAGKQGPKQIDTQVVSGPRDRGDVSDQGAFMEAMERGVLCGELLKKIAPYGRTLMVARHLLGSSWKELAKCFDTSEKATRQALSIGIRNAFGLSMRELQKMGHHGIAEVEKYLVMKNKKGRRGRKMRG
jgi:hypothetical protein